MGHDAVWSDCQPQSPRPRVEWHGRSRPARPRDCGLFQSELRQWGNIKRDGLVSGDGVMKSVAATKLGFRLPPLTIHRSDFFCQIMTGWNMFE